MVDENLTEQSSKILDAEKIKKKIERTFDEVLA